MRLVQCNEAHHIRLGPAWYAKTPKDPIQGLFSMAGHTAAFAAACSVLTTAFFLSPATSKTQRRGSPGGASSGAFFWDAHSLFLKPAINYITIKATSHGRPETKNPAIEQWKAN
jgi:hypothetical protein